MTDKKKNPGKASPTQQKKWAQPRILSTDSIQTLAYTCNSGPAPISGGSCPP